MTAKRFTVEFDGHRYFLVIDEVNERCLARLDTRLDALAWLEMYKMLSEENEQLKQQVQKIHNLIDDNIRIYEDTTTNDEFTQIQLDTKLETLYNLRKELFK